MINRRDLKQLQSLKSVPALSILLPTHRTSPDNKQDPIRVKNLVDEATTRLTEEFTNRELEPLLKNLEALVSEIEYPYTQDESLPLVVGGVVRQISFFQEVSQYTSLIAGTLSGNFDRATIAELTPQMWQIVQSVRKEQQADALRFLDAAMSDRAVVSTIGKAWRLAQEGRGRLLLVEKNYHVPAILTRNGGLELVEQPGGTEVMDDAVDEIIEAVLTKGGNVAIVDDGALSVHQRIALILRY